MRKLKKPQERVQLRPGHIIDSGASYTTPESVREALVTLTLLNKSPLKFMGNKVTSALRGKIKQWTANPLGMTKYKQKTRHTRIWILEEDTEEYKASVRWREEKKIRCEAEEQKRLEDWKKANPDRCVFCRLPKPCLHVGPCWS